MNEIVLREAVFPACLKNNHPAVVHLLPDDDFLIHDVIADIVSAGDKS